MKTAIKLSIIILLIACSSSNKFEQSPFDNNWCWAYTASEMLEIAGYTDYDTALNAFQSNFQNQPYWLELALEWYLGTSNGIKVHSSGFQAVLQSNNKAIGVMIDNPGTNIEHYIISSVLDNDDTIIEIVTLEFNMI